MRAIVIQGQRGAEALSVLEREAPTPGPGQLLVRVRAAGLNRADLLQARGLYPAPPGAPPDIPGLEYAGEVAATGPGATRFAVGDRVMGITSGGAFAELLTVHEREALPIPERLGFDRAAAIPEAFLTVFDAVVLQGGLAMSEVLLVHAATSGVGTAAIQLGQRFGATVVGTGRSPEKLARCAALGLVHAIVVGSPPRFAQAVEERVGRGADVALDLVGGPYLPETLEAAGHRGRVLQVGMLGGARAEVDLGLLMRKRLRLIGTVLRSRPLEEKIRLARAFEARVLPLLADGRLEPVVDEVVPFAQLADAVARMASNQGFGKQVLTWD